MESYVVSCLAMLASVAVCYGSSNGLELIATGGKIQLSKDGSMFTARLAMLQETMNMTAVVDGTAQKHMFSFAATAFTAGTVTTTNATGAAPAFTTQTMTGMAPLGNDVNVTVKLTVMHFTTNGTATVNAETKTVEAGSLAFVCEIADWTFCDGSTNPCNNSGTLETGTNLKAVFEITTSQSGDVVAVGANGFKFGSTMVHLSTKANIAGTSTSLSMSPMFKKEGGNVHVTVLLPKFSTNIAYGPFIVVFDSTTSGSPRLQTGLATVFVVFAALLLR